METWEAIRSRRNVREFTGEPLDRADLERILEAGRRAPSSRNWQPWNFVVVTDRDALRELAKVWMGAAYVDGSAATVALVGRQPGDDFEFARLHYDLGQATAQMMLAAVDLGIGSGHTGVTDQDQARAVLGFPEDHICVYLMALGHPAGRPLEVVERPDRRAFDDVVHWGTW